MYNKKSEKYSSFFAEKNETSFRRGTYVPCLNLKTHDFAYWGGNNVPVDILLYYCCSLNRSSFFFLFVAFLSVLRHFFKAMLLLWCLLFTEPQECGYKGSKAQCPCDLCVFEKRCFFGKKKLVKSSVSTNLFAVKQKCINVQRNIMD